MCGRFSLFASLEKAKQTNSPSRALKFGAVRFSLARPIGFDISIQIFSTLLNTV